MYVYFLYYIGIREIFGGEWVKIYGGKGILIKVIKMNL